VDGRGARCLLGAVALHEVFALKGHAILQGDAATQGFDALDIAVGNCLAVVKEPV
jgi:hypothetical protein